MIKHDITMSEKLACLFIILMMATPLVLLVMEILEDNCITSNPQCEVNK